MMLREVLKLQLDDDTLLLTHLLLPLECCLDEEPESKQLAAASSALWTPVLPGKA